MDPSDLLRSFAEKVEASRSPEGDRQEDGWGYSWLDEAGRWLTHVSLKPIWDETNRLASFPACHTFAVHARSALDHKGEPGFNQPLVNSRFAFVFNGHLQGVSLATEGRFGAEKIWNLLKALLKNHRPPEALQKAHRVLERHSHQITALNLGLCDDDGIFALCYYTAYSWYYQLYQLQDPSVHIICSEPLSVLYAPFYTNSSRLRILSEKGADREVP